MVVGECGVPGWLWWWLKSVCSVSTLCCQAWRLNIISTDKVLLPPSRVVCEREGARQ